MSLRGSGFISTKANSKLCRAALGLPLLLLAVAIGGIACDFNVELTDEKRILEKITGTTPCEADNRLAKGKEGTQKIRLFLVDNRKEAISLEGIDKPPYNLSIKNFSIQTSQGPKVLDVETGSEVPGASVTLSIVQSGETPLSVNPNPRFVEMVGEIGNKRVPKAISLLVDMSDTAGEQDPSRTRASAAATWVLDLFNSDITRGEIDIIQTLLVRNDRLNIDDNLFKPWPTELQYVASDGKKRGFINTTQNNEDTSLDAKNKISEEYTRLSPSSILGKPPLYEAIEAATLDLRTVARESEEPVFNPAVVAISLGRDVTLQTGKDPQKFENAQAAIKGRKTPNDKDDFVPLMAVVYPRPDKEKQEDWDKHLDNLCSLAQAGGSSRIYYWGNIFRVKPGPKAGSQESAREQLDKAYHAMKGYLELKVSYSLSGVEAGKRYLVSFAILGELLSQKTKEDTESPLPRILFEVQP